MERSEKIATIQSILNNTFDKLYVDFDNRNNKEGYLLDKLISSSDEYLDNILSDLKILRGSISKLKMSGIKLWISYTVVDMLPLLQGIDAESGTWFNFGNLNNGNIIVDSGVFSYVEDDVNRLSLDVRKLNMNIQSEYTLENIVSSIDDGEDIKYSMETIDKILQALKKFSFDYIHGKSGNRMGSRLKESSDIMYIIGALFGIISIKNKERHYSMMSGLITDMRNMIDILEMNSQLLENLDESNIRKLMNTLYDMAEIPVSEEIPIAKIDSLQEQSSIITQRSLSI